MYQSEVASIGNWGVEVDQNIVEEIAENTTTNEINNVVSDALERKHEEDAQLDHEEKKEVEGKQDKDMTLEEHSLQRYTLLDFSLQMLVNPHHTKKHKCVQIQPLGTYQWSRRLTPFGTIRHGT